MTDIATDIEAIKREVAEAPVAPGEGRMIRLRRTYDSPIDDVWDALTNPERIGRWFLPVSGDYRLGGRFQFEGNAGGEIVACERPNRLAVTWGYAETGGDATASRLELRLAPDGDEATVLELEHTAVVPDDVWAEYGPGAVGVGWDQGLLGLARHLHGESADSSTFETSPDGRQFAVRSSEAWGAANQAAGADPETVARNIANTTAFYVPGPDTSS
jgi:uncharacterized protein YndB with AHSA1/START domain